MHSAFPASPRLYRLNADEKLTVKPNPEEVEASPLQTEKRNRGMLFVFFVFFM